MKRIILIGCGKDKRSVACPAGQIYVGSTFSLRKRYALDQIRLGLADEYMILSAKYGLVNPESVIEPYDVSLYGMKQTELDVWHEMTAQQLTDKYGHDPVELCFHCGAPYAGLYPYLPTTYKVDLPLEGVSQGFQKKFYIDYFKNQKPQTTLEL